MAIMKTERKKTEIDELDCELQVSLSRMELKVDHTTLSSLQTVSTRSSQKTTKSKQY